MELWQKFWEIFFWLNLPVTAFIAWRIFLMDRKAQRLKKQIERDLHFPGMEATRHFFKPRLKAYRIKVDDKYYEKN